MSKLTAHNCTLKSKLSIFSTQYLGYVNKGLNGTNLPSLQPYYIVRVAVRCIFVMGILCLSHIEKWGMTEMS